MAGDAGWAWATPGLAARERWTNQAPATTALVVEHDKQPASDHRALYMPLYTPPHVWCQGAVHHLFNGKPKATGVDEWDRLVAARDAKLLEQWRQKQG